jgi:hypothetical protein
MDVVLELPVFANLLTRTDVNFAFGSQSWAVQQKVKRDLVEIEAKTRRRKDKFAEIRGIVDEIDARIGAAEIRRFRDGVNLSMAEYSSLCDNGLYGAIFGSRHVLDVMILKYVRDGLPID